MYSFKSIFELWVVCQLRAPCLEYPLICWSGELGGGRPPWSGKPTVTSGRTSSNEKDGGVKRQVLTRKGAASQSARPPSSSPGWSPRSRCCSGGARWSTRSWRGCCCGSTGGAAGARSPRSPLKTPVWLDRWMSYPWSNPRWSWGGRKKAIQITSEQQALKWFTTLFFSRESIFLGTVLLKYLTL